VNFLHQIWDMRARSDIENIGNWWENAALLHILKNMSPQELAAHVEFAPQSQFNAYPVAVHCGHAWQPGELVVHATGPGKEVFPGGPEFNYIAEHAQELA
jgi:hypothetical protein